ncbi:MAG: hypothetical protein J5545_10030 [Bacteroidaceae bacterium]|nr:hypothetical protein [Bacteroidaceae bacterium]
MIFILWDSVFKEKHVLEPLREAFDTPVIITSGYRSLPLNEAVGSVKKRQTAGRLRKR